MIEHHKRHATLDKPNFKQDILDLVLGVPSRTFRNKVPTLRHIGELANSAVYARVLYAVSVQTQEQITDHLAEPIAGYLEEQVVNLSLQ